MRSPTSIEFTCDQEVQLAIVPNDDGRTASVDVVFRWLRAQLISTGRSSGDRRILPLAAVGNVQRQTPGFVDALMRLNLVTKPP